MAGVIDRNVRIKVRLRQWWWDVSGEVGGSQDGSRGGDRRRRRRGGTVKERQSQYLAYWLKHKYRMATIEAEISEI